MFKHTSRGVASRDHFLWDLALSGLLSPRPSTSCLAGSLTCAFPQGVTLTDLQEAERTFSRARAERQAQEQPGQKPVGARGLEGHPGRDEPPTGPTAEAGEGRQPRGRGPDAEVSSLRCAWAGRAADAGPLLGHITRGAHVARQRPLAARPA